MRRLSPREINLLRVCGAGLLLLAFWLIAVSPALHERATSMAQLTDLDRLSSVLDRVSPAQDRPAETNLPPLRQRVTETAATAAIEIQRLDPQGSALSVSLGDVGFSNLAGWFDVLTTTQRVRIVGAEIARRPTPGVVSARLVLESLQ